MSHVVIDQEPLGHDPVPADLLELFEMLEFQRLTTEGALDHAVMRMSSMLGVVSDPLWVTRAGWGAHAASLSTDITPNQLAIHWEGPKMGIFPHASCTTKVRGIQQYHLSKGWADIAYSHMVCPHGYVFECRGKGRRTAANGTNEANQHAYAVCFLGGGTDPFTDLAKDGIWRAAYDLGMARAPWRPHRFYFNSQCPGPYEEDWINVGHPRPMVSPSNPTPPITPPTPVVDDLRRRVMAKPILEEGAGAPGPREGQMQDVRILQGLMLAHGALPISESGNIDGKFSNVTRRGLTDWQARTKALSANGRVDAPVWAWLMGV